MRKFLVGVLAFFLLAYMVGRLGEAIYATPKDPAQEALANEDRLISVLGRQWAQASLPGEKVGFAYVSRVPNSKPQQWEFEGDVRETKYNGIMVHDLKCGSLPHCYSPTMIWVGGAVVFRAPR